MSRDSAASHAGIVVTSIAAPNAALTEIAAGCLRHGMGFWVIGDVPSPPDFSLEGCRFLGLQDQIDTGFRLAALCPTRHYARKNIGYLAAMRAGISVLVETDDDNLPRAEFWNPREPWRLHPTISGGGWVNVYGYFTKANIWPRGLPLDAVQQGALSLDSIPIVRTFCPIQQGLADGDPDVDAIYRLILPLPIDFDPSVNVVLSRGAWCPFNSQNTTWFQEAFPLLYLPAYCSFRMTDIWRSFVAQRICWENDWSLLFHGPTVCQERNAHDRMRDFADEIPGYLHNRRIAEKLDSLTLVRGQTALPENLLCCYEALIRMEVLDRKELPLVEAWVADLLELGYGTSQGRAL